MRACSNIRRCSSGCVSRWPGTTRAAEKAAVIPVGCLIPPHALLELAASAFAYKACSSGVTSPAAGPRSRRTVRNGIDVAAGAAARPGGQHRRGQGPAGRARRADPRLPGDQLLRAAVPQPRPVAAHRPSLRTRRDGKLVVQQTHCRSVRLKFPDRKRRAAVHRPRIVSNAAAAERCSDRTSPHPLLSPAGAAARRRALQRQLQRLLLASTTQQRAPDTCARALLSAAAAVAAVALADLLPLLADATIVRYLQVCRRRTAALRCSQVAAGRSQAEAAACRDAQAALSARQSVAVEHLAGAGGIANAAKTLAGRTERRRTLAAAMCADARNVQVGRCLPRMLTSIVGADKAGLPLLQVNVNACPSSWLLKDRVLATALAWMHMHCWSLLACSCSWQKHIVKERAGMQDVVQRAERMVAALDDLVCVGACEARWMGIAGGRWMGIAQERAGCAKP
eukprot:364089-Chlamydomonas_euryale.AAC.14